MRNAHELILSVGQLIFTVERALLFFLGNDN